MRLNLRRFALEPEQQRAAMLEATAASVAQMKGPFRNRLLVAVFIQPERTKSGLILPDKTLDEAKFQGKAGLVLKLGPMAFKFDDEEQISAPEVGDWVFFRAADSWDCAISVGGGEGVVCRLVFDDCIVGVVDDPESIW